MIIANVHMNSPIELRFTIVDGERFVTRFIFVKGDESPIRVAQMIAENVNLYEATKGNRYDEAEHIAGILRDAARYGCD